MPFSSNLNVFKESLAHLATLVASLKDGGNARTVATDKCRHGACQCSGGVERVPEKLTELVFPL